MGFSDGWEGTIDTEQQGYTPPEEAPQNYEETNIADMNAQQQLTYGAQTVDPWMEGLLDPHNPFMQGVNAAEDKLVKESDMRITNQDESGDWVKPGYHDALNSLKKREGKYDTIGDIGDGAGLSIGAYQFTEKSGGALQLAKKLGLKSVSELTPELLRSQQGRRAQDELVLSKYFKPAERAAARHNVTDPKAIEFLVDTNVNGGMSNVISRAKKMKGGLTLANLKKARKARYRKLYADNPKRWGEFIKGWLARVDNFA